MKVRAELRGADLRLDATPDGRLRVRVPVAVKVATRLSTAAKLAVYRQGCRDATFHVGAEFLPAIASQGQLQYHLGPVTVDRKDYLCKIVSNVAYDAIDAVKNFGQTLRENGTEKTGQIYFRIRFLVFSQSAS